MSNPSNPTNKSSGINFGNIDSGQNTGISLTGVAGGDQNTITNSPGASINYITIEGRRALFVGVPAMPNPFVGRDELMKETVQQLTSGQNLALSAEGLPGVGKTTLAVALAYHPDILTHFSNGILWASLGTAPDVLSALGRWAEALGGDVTHLPTAPQRQQAVRDLIGQKRLLLIIDDAWQFEATQLLRCGGPYCVHLLTTRDKGIARSFAGSQPLTAVPPLEDDPASQLLQTLAPLAWGTDPAAVRQLAQAVGGLPLALELLGGYLADPNAPERHYFPVARQVALADLTVPAQRLQLAAQRLGSHDGPISLQATIALSLADLPDTTRNAFYALGAFAPKPATFSQEAALAVTQATERDVAVLLERNLLAWDGSYCTLHQTLADVAVSHLPPDARTRHWDYYLAQANADRQAWQQIQTLYEQIQWAWHNAPDAPDTLKLLWAVNIFRRRRGLWTDYMAGAERGLVICQVQDLREDEGVLLVHLGYAYDALGQWQTALDYYQRALRIWEEIGNRAGQANTLNNIGMVYNALGQQQMALDYYQQALPIQEEVGDRAGQAATLSNIGTVYNALGQVQTALEYYQRVLPIWEEVGDRAGQATTLNNIGAVYNALGQRQTALDYYLGALTIHEEVGDCDGEAVTRYNMATIYRAQGDLAGAVAQLRQVVALDRLVQHPDLEADAALLAELEAELAQQKP